MLCLHLRARRQYQLGRLRGRRLQQLSLVEFLLRLGRRDNGLCCKGDFELSYGDPNPGSDGRAHSRTDDRRAVVRADSGADCGLLRLTRIDARSCLFRWLPWCSHPVWRSFRTLVHGFGGVLCNCAIK